MNSKIIGFYAKNILSEDIELTLAEDFVKKISFSTLINPNSS